MPQEVTRQAGTGPATDITETAGTAPRLRRLRPSLLLIAPVIVAIGSLYFYLSGGRYESTDNAYVQSGLVSITPRVSGQVVAIEVRENQPVRAGDILFRIDPAGYQTALASARAKLAEAHTRVSAQREDYKASRGRIEAAHAQLDYATREAARQKNLLTQGISSQDQYDQAILAMKSARQNIAIANGQASSIEAALSGDVNAPAVHQPGVRLATASVDDAQLNLSYTVVRAPQDGVITKVNQVQVGGYVTAGRPVLTLVGRHLWIEANFKENQLQHMRLGQAASFKIDAFSNRELKGHISSFSPGTGSSFAVLPPENATGNWVKVVQRLPVQLEIDNLPTDLPLQAGLSVAVTVDTGHRRRLFRQDAPPAILALRRGP